MEVTARIAARSASSRSAYLERIRAAAAEGPARGDLGCANLAHGLAACGADEKLHLQAAERRNVAIVSAYNDMLSAHQPFERYPSILKKAVLQAGGVAQMAGGVPAMCDGITQGRAGMELSLFSRDVVAMSTAIALSHDMFDGALMLGVCDKIVPGLLIGALSFGHLPTVFVPAGPMPSGIPNGEKSRTRQRFAAGEIGRDELLEAELGSYHSPGTCTFYGTANSNQLVVEAMGLHLPGSSFVNPGTDLRRALTVEAGRVATPGLRADRRDRRRARARQRRRRAAGHRRLDQPHDAPGRGRGRRRAAAHLGRLRRPQRRDAAARPRLPQRPGRHQPVPRRRRRPVRDRRAARRGPHAPGRRHRRGPRPRPLPRRAVPGRGRRAALAPRAARDRRDPSRPAPATRRVRARRRHPRARRRPRPRRHEGERRRARAPRRRPRPRASSTTRATSSPPSTAASSTATSSRSSAIRARAPTACPSCTSSRPRSAC